MGFDLAKVREDFPILSREVAGYPLAYLDSANTSQKPIQVVQAISKFYLNHNANVARAMHLLGAEATEGYESARAKIAGFIGCNNPEEIVFTKNASEALNLAASSLSQKLTPGDEVVISVMEHHSNLVPWQLACQRSGATLRWFDITDEGRLDIDKAREENLINERTRIVSLTWQSNVLGTINPMSQIADWAHSIGAVFVVDGSQAVPHQPTDVNQLGADLFAFTGHKMCGPSGIGILWGKYDLLASLPPYMGGGEMIEIVKMEGSTYAPPPYRFEAGTPPIVQAFGLGQAIDYLNQIGMENIAARSEELGGYLLQKLLNIDGLNILGPKENIDRGCAVSFTLDSVHPHDVMQLLDARGVAVRGGHHCAAPLHSRLKVSASTRASAYFYTSEAEIDQLADALIYARDFFTGRLRGK